MTAIYKSERGARAVRERYLQFLDRWPVPSERMVVPTREGETFVLACGPKNAPTLLLFHGSGANATMWLGDIGEWSKHFRCYAVDMIGEPGLSAPSRPKLGGDAYALWLDDVLMGLKVKRASIIGVSLGGWLALDYATRRPDRVEKLVLVCPGGVGRQKSVVLLALPLMFLGGWGRRRLRSFVLGDAMRDTPGMKEMADFSSLVFSTFIPRRGKLPVFSDDKLRALTMPLLAVVGGRDVLLDSRQTARRLKRAVPNADVSLLPKTGHLIRDQTGPILDFLTRA
ncbi:MAG TPA: alpha/beta hydrolase [Rhizomicrobium sp.]|nr:alpha/beta hydrolase [Rhizomicrobium sp.]